jgi:hypothetical protein
MNRGDIQARWEAAYRACEYAVLLPGGELMLRPGIADAANDARLAAEAGILRHWAVITPCNPGSRRLDAAANAARLEQMRAWLIGHGCRYVRALNRDPAGNWPDEPGFLLCDPAIGMPRELAKRYGQNAFLAGRFGAAPALIWLAG